MRIAYEIKGYTRGGQAEKKTAYKEIAKKTPAPAKRYEVREEIKK